jgi:ribonuclease HI
VNKNKAIIFSDGASKGNPGPGGFGAVVVSNGKVTELGGFEKETTNNRMELCAAISGLSKADQTDVEIYTDSKYVINGITKWVFAWQKNNWQTKEKKPVSNKDLWQELFAKIQGKEIKWNYVGGHIGIAGNERCDEIASAYAVGDKVELYSGPVSDYIIDILNFSFDENLKQEKSSGAKRSSATAYSYVSLVGGVIYKDKTWAECEKRVKGKSNVKFKKALSAIEEEEIIKGWGY